MPTRLQSLLRVKDPDSAFKFTQKELLLFHYASAMPTVCFHCTV